MCLTNVDVTVLRPATSPCRRRSFVGGCEVSFAEMKVNVRCERASGGVP